MQDSAHKTQSRYAPTPTDDEVGGMLFEAQNERRPSSRQPRWKRAFRSPQARGIGVVVVLVALLSAGVVGYLRYQAADSENEQLLQLRSFSRHAASEDIEIIGQMYLYFRKSQHYSGRRSLQRLAVPVARYSSRRFPLKGPFINLKPWLPIFADRRSKQTIIYSKRNGIYVLPALINKHRKRFSIAELIVAGYVSLSSNRARPRDFIDMDTLFRPDTLDGFDIPTINPLAGGFTDGMHTNYGSFSIPKYRETEFDIDSLLESDEKEEDDDDDNDEDSRDRYQSDKRPYRPPRRPTRRYQTYTTKRRTTTITTTKSTKRTTKRHMNGTHADKKRDGSVAYLQASNTRNQLTDRTPKVVKYNSLDSYKGYSPYRDGPFTYKMNGVYLSVYAGQVGSPKGNGEGALHLWTRQAGKDQSNSNTIQTIEKGRTSVLPYVAIFQAPIGQDITPTFSTYASNKCSPLGLIATDYENEPLVPSIITSEIQLSNSNNFSFSDFSAKVTQLGSSTPRPVKFERSNSSTSLTSDSVATDGVIQFPHAGFFFVAINFQVGGAPGTRPTGTFHMWPRLNGEDVENSNLVQDVHRGSISVVLSQSFFKVNADDKLQMVFTTTDKNIGLISTQPEHEPLSVAAYIILFELGKRGRSVPHAQVSSLKSQWGCIEPTTITLESDDFSFQIKNRDGELTFLESGIYLLIASGQVGSDDGQGTGDVHLWYQVNGDDVPNSNSIQTVNADTTLLISPTVLSIRAHDKVSLRFSTDATKGKLGFVASQPENEPAVSSMFVTAFKSSAGEWKQDSHSHEN